MMDDEPTLQWSDMPKCGLCNATALRRAMRRVSLVYDSCIAQCGLKATQRSILGYVSRAGAPTVGLLADELMLCRSALTHNLAPLERDGLVTVSQDPKNARIRLVRLTPKGLEKLKQSTVLWQGAQDRFESAFGEKEARKLRAILNGIGRLNF
jgi:DNA-binding MarR family transcriptional regulator